jgi:hypothetical protein
MRAVRLRLPSPWASSLVHSDDGARVFGVAQDGDLWSVEVPRDFSRPPALARREREASEGAVVAAGWIEDRLATVAVRGAELELSHGEYGLNLAPSCALRVPLGPIRLAARTRLDPYVRWWQEVNPVEELFGGVSLVRGADDRLFAVAAWRDEGELRTQVTPVADDVTALALREDHASAVIVGRVGETRGIFLLNRQLTGSPGLLRRIEGRTPLRAVTGFPGGTLTASHFAVAVEETPGTWSVHHVGTSHDGERRPSAVVVERGHVIGVADAGLVVLDDTRTSLSWVRPGGRTPLVQGSETIASASVNPMAPVVAFVTEGAELGFVAVSSGSA